MKRKDFFAACGIAASVSLMGSIPLANLPPSPTNGKWVAGVTGGILARSVYLTNGQPWCNVRLSSGPISPSALGYVSCSGADGVTDDAAVIQWALNPLPERQSGLHTCRHLSDTVSTVSHRDLFLGWE